MVTKLKRFLVTLFPEDRSRLEALAKIFGLDKSATIRKLISDAAKMRGLK
jgi:hypothetical protein